MQKRPDKRSIRKLLNENDANSLIADLKYSIKQYGQNSAEAQLALNRLVVYRDNTNIQPEKEAINKFIIDEKVEINKEAEKNESTEDIKGVNKKEKREKNQSEGKSYLFKNEFRPR